MARKSVRKAAITRVGALASPPSTPPPAAKKAVARGITKRVVSSRVIHAPIFFMHEYVKYYLRATAAVLGKAAVAKPAAARAPTSPTKAKAPVKAKAPKAARPAFAAFTGSGTHGDASPEQLQRGTHHLPPLLTADARAPNIEVCFSFDTTGSMQSYINVVKERIQEIARTLVSDLPDIRISVIAHGDYCDADRYVLKRLDLSNDANGIASFIRGITQTYGGDSDECYEYVLQQARGLSWTPGTARALVVVGDAAPHPKNQYFRIDWEEELAALVGMGVRCYGVRCGHSGGRFYDEISERSGGKCLTLDKIADVVELIMGLCYREAAVFHMERPDAPDHGAHAGDTVRVPQAGAGVEVSPAERARHMAVHRAIHDLAADSVTFDGVVYRVSLGGGGCRWVKIGDMVYIEQTKEETSRYAALAQEGRAITWMLRRGQWGMIMDGELHGAARPESAHDAFVPDTIEDSRIGEAPAGGRRRRR